MHMGVESVRSGKAVLFGLALLLGVVPALASDDKDSREPGELDPGFGTGGIVTSNPSPRSDWARVMAIDSSFMYVVGSNCVPGPSDSQWWIEKRSLKDGSLDPGFGTGGEVTSNPSEDGDSAFQIAIDAVFMYVVGGDKSQGRGQWRIEKRRLEDGSLVDSFGKGGVVTSNPSSSDLSGATGVAIDASFMYVIGEDGTGGSTRWRIEKRGLADGSLDAGFGAEGAVTSAPSNKDDWPTDLAITSSFMYVVGVAGIGGSSDSLWRVEKRRLADGSLDAAFGVGGVVTSNPSTVDDAGDEKTGGIAVDSGFLYVVGNDLTLGPSDWQWRIEKRSLNDGSLVDSFGKGGVVQSNPSPGADYPWDIAIDSGFLYVAGQQEGRGGSDRDWRIEKRRAKDGSLDPGFGTGGAVTSVPGPLWDMARAVTVDSRFLYVAGSDDGRGKPDRQRRIEKRSK